MYDLRPREKLPQAAQKSGQGKDQNVMETGFPRNLMETPSIATMGSGGG